MQIHRKLVLLFGLFVFTISWGQREKTDKFPSYFGIFASPVIPNNFIGDVQTNMQDTAQSMFATYTHKTGLNFGAIVRIGLTKTVSIETGISQVRRNYRVDVSVPDSGFVGSQNLAFVNYDIPINALFYVQLSEQWYMNAAIGFSINQYPSDSRDEIFFDQKHKATVEARRTIRTGFAANAGLGFEYRTEDYGTFYLGGGAKVPFKDPFWGVVIASTVSSGNDKVAYSPISTGYFTVDFRYFIPYKRKKDFEINNPLN
jgi:hypothetical protein